jgi:hypothetical protein
MPGFVIGKGGSGGADRCAVGDVEEDAHGDWKPKRIAGGSRYVSGQRAVR